ncbi:adenylate/guanylate cyclase domain-containing protein [Acuticoccus kandeliae]|uniref:adenylate/guanylate cyclase domain-containing protein n=1 Tax=Acuticoccus kandeliae TaxID=2073160 RepID=UPI000D3ED5D7|nr:adenylate/guanylate cyclase domain-containing protein [Acuticoccus kandeliae]
MRDATPTPGSVSAAIAREELAGLVTMYRARFVALAALGLWLLATIPVERSSQYLAVLGAFALLGLPPYLLAARGIRLTSLTALFLLADIVLLTTLLILPPPFMSEGWTAQLNLRLPSFMYLGVFLVGVSLCYSPALVLWTGAAVTLVWSSGYLWVASLPGSRVHTAQQVMEDAASPDGVAAIYLNSASVSLTSLVNQIVFFVLVTAILTLAVWRSRALVRRQIAAEAERAALSRYFSPNIVGTLTAGSAALDQPRRQKAAILFADMVAFTTASEQMTPEALFALLREFHSRLARTVFAFDGTLDKYIGDALMVHFGTPQPHDDDPVRALRCAAAMLTEIDRWNEERAAEGRAPVQLGLGVHYGEVIVGNVGDARRLEFTALGDTVNVAERLERLTRDLDTRLVASDSLIAAARRCGIAPTDVLPTLVRGPTTTVRRRREPVDIWLVADPARASVHRQGR